MAMRSIVGLVEATGEVIVGECYALMGVTHDINNQSIGAAGG